MSSGVNRSETFWIREETPEDRAAIGELNRLAFGGEVEAALVDSLREEGAVVLSLVAGDSSGIIGHILFSLVVVADRWPACSLAPMAVHPQRQRQGIGSALVHRGLEICRDRGERIVVVVGHPEYYPRFGFSARLARRLESPWSKEAGEAWMALELTPGALEGVSGWVQYPAAFENVSD